MKKPTALLAAFLTAASPLAGTAFADPFSDPLNGAFKYVGDGKRTLHPFGGDDNNVPAAKPAPVSPQGSKLKPSEAERSSLIAKVKPGVVKIEAGKSLGTGFFIDPSGIIVTNAHAIGDVAVGDELDITTSDEENHKAHVLAVGDHEKRGKDMAFLQISQDGNDKDKKWPALDFDDGTSVVEGMDVLAIGHPYDLDFTSTKGMVSTVNRHLPNSVMTFVQTDAAINPGNSGGPLFNLAGKVIGMNTQIITASGGSNGLGFAIVTEDITLGWEQYKRTGNLDTGYIGASLLYDDKKKGLAVEAVAPGSPARKARLKAGDLIVSVEGKELPQKNPGEALRLALHAIAFKSAGESLGMTVRRGGQDINVKLTIGKWPAPHKGEMASLDSEPSFDSAPTADAAML